MASRYYQRPENAISKADEFLQVGKPERALDTLYEVIKAKRRNHTVSEKLIEQIMFKYLDLCVELKKSHVAKEGLFQYRNMCQATNVASLAAVVQGYLNMAEKRTDEAKQESVESVEGLKVDDLENLATPEVIMLSAVSGEDAQDRSDRTILMPWVKFLWESYCQCLELLRTNVRVERLYHDIAQQAFRFCLKYQRKTEFRKLCDKLRNHLDLILKQTPSPMTINLHNSDTQQMNLDTRLVQLDAAIAMELWQEAFKAVEDIHGLMTFSKKTFQPKMMANYYQKLARVFWKSGNHLFHAAAIFKHFQLTREMKKSLSADELGRMASRVLTACLAVPIPSQHPEFDKFIETDRTPQEKMARLAVLLSLQQPPTRQSLLRDASRFGVVQAAVPHVQDMYNFLEVEFHPLKLCSKMEASMKLVEENEGLSLLADYLPALKEVTLVRLLKQVSQVYQSVCFKRLLELAPFSNSFELERIIVDCVRHNDMQIRVDHRTRTVQFGTDLTEAQSYTAAEGPHLQDMPSEQIRTQLIRMLEVLDKSRKTIHPEEKKIENAKLRTKIVEAYHSSKQRDHQRILARHKIIEERKEYLEKLSMHREAEEAKKVVEKQREAKKLEDERLAAETAARLHRMEIDKMKAIKKAHMDERIDQIKQTDIGKKILENMKEDEIAELDTDQIMAKQVEELEREKKELNERCKAQDRKLDHQERARRREEIPLLKAAFEVDKEEDKVLWKKQEEERIKQAIVDREVAVKTRDRLMRMKDDKDAFLGDLLKNRQAVYDKKVADFNSRVERERAIRMAERKQKRKEDREAEWLQDKREKEQRRRDEEIKRQKEEQEKKAAEEKERREEEYRKKREELDRVAAKQLAREKEMEERVQREKEESRAALLKNREEFAQREGRGGDRDRDDRDRQGDGERDSWRGSRGGGGGGGGGGGRDREGDDGWRRNDDRREPERRGGDRDRRDDRRDDRGGGDRDRDRRGGGGDDRPSGGGGSAWKPGTGSWRDREKRKDDEWSRPPRQERDGRDEGRGDRDMQRRDDRGDRDMMRRDDRGGGEMRRDDREQRGDRDMRRRDEDDRGGDNWRRGGGGGGGGERDDRGPRGGPRDERRGGGGGRDDREIRRERGPRDEDGGGGGWRNRGDDNRGERRDDRRDDRRDERRGGGGGGGGDSWRRSGGGVGGDRPQEERRGEEPKKEKREERGGGGADDDGWTTVKK